MGRPFYGAQNILDSQNNGYRDTASAISELVDNSIQANANSVDIIIIQDKRNRDEIIDVLIVDDGDGMNEDQFQFALQRSSGTRAGAKKGLGKYGEGLPNASLSQTKRTEVYTQSKVGKLLFNYIDIQEMYDLQDTNLKDIEKRNSIEIPLIKSKAYSNKNISTLVLWHNPNRIKPRSTSRVCEDLHRQLGRIFRYYIKGFNDEEGYRQVNINILVYDSPKEGVYTLNKTLGGKVIPFDPMFLMEGTTLEQEFPNYNHPTNQLHCDPVIKKFKVEYNGESVETEVKILFSYIKKEERYREGKDFGSTSFGQLYKKRNQKGGGYSNISIMRANREILSGNFGFIHDISLPQHRFWSVEVHIEPVIDDIVGLDNKKQQASFIRFYEPDEADSEHPILVEISRLISNNIESMFKVIREQAIGARNTPDSNGKNPKSLPGSNEEKGTPTGKGVPENKGKEINELINWITERYGKELDSKQIESIAKNTIEGKNNHIFVPSELGPGTLYAYQEFGDKVLIEINQTSLLYDKVLEELKATNNINGERAIYMLIGALVNAEMNNVTQDKNIKNFMKRIRTEFGLSLDEYIEAIYL
jgi:hypothetical protein